MSHLLLEANVQDAVSLVYDETLQVLVHEGRRVLYNTPSDTARSDAARSDTRSDAARSDAARSDAARSDAASLPPAHPFQPPLLTSANELTHEDCGRLSSGQVVILHDFNTSVTRNI